MTNVMNSPMHIQGLIAIRDAKVTLYKTLDKAMMDMLLKMEVSGVKASTHPGYLCLVSELERTRTHLKSLEVTIQIAQEKSRG